MHTNSDTSNINEEQRCSLPATIAAWVVAAVFFTAFMLFSSAVWAEDINDAPAAGEVTESPAPRDAAEKTPETPQEASGEAFPDIPPENTVPSPQGAVPSQEVTVSTPPTATLKGVVLERGTRKPVPYAQIVFEDTDIFAESDDNGGFEITDIAPKSYSVIVTAIGFDKITVPETFKAGEVVDVVYYLEAEMYGLEEIVVRGRKARKEVSRQVVTRAELKAMPGSGGDPVKAIENLPGVGNFASSGGLVLRGSNREDSRTYLDGHEIPLLFHFGGFKSVYNADLLGDIEVLLGGFGAEYGGAIGGIVNLRSREPRRDRWSGYIDTSFLDATAFAEGPTSENTAAAFTVRYSLIQYILKAIPFGDALSFTTYPNYYDYVFRFDHWINSSNKLTFSLNGARDGAEVYLSDVSERDPALTGNLGFATMFHTFYMTWDFKQGAISNVFSPALRMTKLQFNLNQDFKFDLFTFTGEVYDNFTIRLGKYNELTIGARLSASTAYIDAKIGNAPKEGDVYISFSNNNTQTISTQGTGEELSLYAEDVFSYKGLKLIPGVRFSKAFNITEAWWVDPRLAVRYEIIKPLTVKASVGWYHQLPQPDEVFEPYGNPGLWAEAGVQTSAGVEWDITDAINLGVEGYYKYLYDLAISDPVEKYANNGTAYIYGIEVLLRHKLTKNFFGWLAYSYSVSKRKDGPDANYRFFDEDVPHNLTLVLSYKFLKTWQVGSRLQVVSGYPYTDIKGGLYIVDNNTYIPIYDSAKKNAKRLPLWYQWDIRVDKQFIFDTWILSVYLDVQNITMANRVTGYQYNFDYSEKTERKLLPIIPAFGVRADF